MPSEFTVRRALAACSLAGLVAACAVPAPVPPPPPAPAPAVEPMRVMVLPPPQAAPEPPPAPPAAAARQGAVHPLEAAIGYAEHVRTLPAPELTQEVQRLGDSSYAPSRATQLALALAQTRTPAGAARAQSLLQRVLADASAEARGLHGLARLLSIQIAEQRRLEEQAERQAQQLRDAQRRIEQLNDRLEAVRAIERSLPGPAQRAPARP